EILSGKRPIETIFGRDPFPLALSTALGLGLLALLAYRWRWRELRKPSESRGLLLSALGATVVLVVYCYRGRTLTLQGDERYVLALAPVWTLLLAEAWARSTKFRDPALAAFLALGVVRAALVLVPASLETDPLREAAMLVKERCPKGGCIALAEDYWIYWPLRYYSRDRVDANYWSLNWAGGPLHPTAGRQVLSCWSRVPGIPAPELSSVAAEFPAGNRFPAIRCHWTKPAR
ncbi:MAG TPA: hypothetical protein VM598_09435, partial [Bdellovibrionota bacterium]|nr:hypothetical protein [Bdellovibrionota bacterium]